MTSMDASVARIERYVHQAVHWNQPALALLVLVYGTAVRPGPPIGLVVATAVTTAVAGLAGLCVLHTSLRTAGDLGPSRWDRLFHTPRHRRLAAAIWAVAAVVTCLLVARLAPTAIDDTLTLYALIASMVAAGLAQPILGLARRPAPTYVAALALAALCLAGSPDAGTAYARIAMAVPVAVWAVMWPSITVMMLNILRITHQLNRLRHDSARLAVAEERLRFSRDLHDVFGRTLSAVALKSELAAAQAERGRPEASATMREVQAIAAGALTEVREVVRGYREADLTAELAGARSLLESAGIRVSTVVDAAPLPPPVARCFAWVVREASTNVLRHSNATHVQLSLARDASGATLTVADDGLARPVGTGSGLAGLAERLAAVDGTLDAGAHGDGWRLRAHVDAAALARLDAAGSQA